ncbi:MAG: response regulator transcription factor [Meiothermus sp.]|uniref:response regulator transcription factor n=1 Tax=Meiothermus sp. TaxID=1955249 RepID=UPI0025E24582|nr:response regulator transcription factor [Meiothermus sp.]MCS7195105.1 response regulator transcription factor [Meiothermus sp.]MCX7740257.1 response regulator transcription factor [Meiothermus sp.]MDW8091037.1 response regulator transcription factor [Meiothermus sp.]
MVGGEDRKGGAAALRVLVVEDEPGVRSLLSEALQDAGFAVDEATGVEEAQGLLLAFPYDLLVLDLFLPDGDGLEVLRFARDRRLTLPVLILTARDDLETRLEGLDGGADDYVVKPFYSQEVVARARALLRRSRGLAENRVRAGRLELDLEGRLSYWEGREVALTAREFALLAALALKGEGFSTREELLEKVWSGEESVDPRTVDTYIKYLRRKLSHEAIESARGLGYRFRG